MTKSYYMLQQKLDQKTKYQIAFYQSVQNK